MKVSKWVVTLAVIGLVPLILWVSARPYHITGDCMEPAIRDGMWYFVNQLSPYLKKPRISDIIVFSHEDKPWISRIVALENDVIQISEGCIFVNGILEEGSISRNWANWDYGTFGIDRPCQIPKNHVFVLSDNLDSKHDDSRVFGPIHNSFISGHVW